MTGRRSRFARSAALLVLAAAACGTPARRYVLESPPPSPDLVGRLEYRVARADDTLVDLAPALGVGYVELFAANPGVDPWLPKEGTGIVVNLGDLHLYYFEEGRPPRVYPIGIAKDGYETPIGVTTVKAKRERPTWIPGPSARADGKPARVEPGPDNPLGLHALYLGWPSYLIHGT